MLSSALMTVAEEVCSVTKIPTITIRAPSPVSQVTVWPNLALFWEMIGGAGRLPRLFCVY